MVHVTGLKDWNIAANHESSLTEAEMISLVLRIKSEIFEDKAPPTETNFNIKKLWLILNGDSNASIFIKKGIHQDGELHYTLKFNTTDTIHVYVTGGDVVAVDKKPVMWGAPGRVGWKEPLDTVKYKNSGLTVKLDETNEAKFPAIFAKQTTEQVKNRRHSFSIGNVGLIGKMMSNSQAPNLHP